MPDGLPNLTPGESTLLRDELFMIAYQADDGRLHGMCFQSLDGAGPGIPLIGDRKRAALSLPKVRQMMGSRADRVRVIRFRKADDCTGGFEEQRN